MSIEIVVENIKCGGCASSITENLLQQDGVKLVEIDIESGTVLIDGDIGLRDSYAEALSTLGYPEQGTLQGIGLVGAKAKSFVSCAVGRISD